MTLNKQQEVFLKKLEEEIGIEINEKRYSRQNGYQHANGRIIQLTLNNLGLEEIPINVLNFKYLKVLSLSGNLIETVRSIKELNELIELDLKSNRLRDLNFLSHHSQLIKLDLSENQISDIKPLSNLTELKELVLYKNEITDLEPLRTLVSLEELVLYNNNISDISGLEYLTSLIKCDLDSNQITDLTPLKDLTNLNHLYLSFNSNIVPDPLSNITSLKSLSVIFTDLRELNWVCNLKNLVNLRIGYNHIHDITALSSLSELASLEMERLPLKSFTSLKDLTNLTSLDISQTKIIETEIFKELKQLRTLTMNGCELSDVSFLREMNWLKSLKLKDNQLNSIDCLWQLDQLLRIDLENNCISNFPRWLLTSTMEISTRVGVDGFSLQGNPIEDVPNIFLKQGKGAIGDYLKSLESGSEPINEIKVILLGEGAAGKTSLVNFLEGKPFNSTQSQTHGINIAECVREKGITMKVWDFGGQDIMHHTHQLFLTQNSVYVLVLNARENTDTEKWLKLIKVFGGDSPIIIVTNKIDENPSSHENIKHLNSKYPNLDNRYVRISCATEEGLPQFQSLLEETIDGLLHVRTQWGISWLSVKNELEEMRKGSELKDYIHYDKYEEICDQHGVFRSHRDTLITWLHQLGVVTYFPDTNLSETNVINPAWLTEAFYAIINARSVAENYGKFTVSELSRLIPIEKYPKHKYGFLLGLMTKFELCYQLDEQTYLIPDLLQKEEPSFLFSTNNSLKFKYKYTTLLPKAIFPKFTVRRHREISANLQWRSGLLINDKTFGARALIRIDEEEKDISIYVNGEEPRGYLASILSSFNSINELYENLDFEELVPCNCKSCRNKEKPFYYKHSLLCKLKEKNNNSILCEHSLEYTVISELLGILIRPEEMEEEIRKLTGSGSYLTKKYLEEGNIEDFIVTIKSMFSSVSYLLFERHEKAYHVPLFMMLRSIFGNQAKVDEVQSKGRSDIILNLASKVFIFELKLDGNSQEAIDQIYEKKYFEPYILERKPIELIGINFNSDDRNVDSFQYETLKLTPFSKRSAN